MNSDTLRRWDINSRERSNTEREGDICVIVKDHRVARYFLASRRFDLGHF
jgi:hypothetical protein